MADLPSWARRGMRVVCIRSPWKRPSLPPFVNPLVGDVLTIREVAFNEPRQKWGATFMERHHDEFYVLENNFRPAVEPKSEAHDLALFKSWLPHNETEPA